ncbi:hypothetical protein [Bordetella sp. LUAb4]|uniref:hypothetical protein n=1 Tax=Bordetella sp. LUAb4 TaxID=2843195 RepID=UPI001E638014|nr:hypothetical protein [Bordetella sp. LUAb4]
MNTAAYSPGENIYVPAKIAEHIQRKDELIQQVDALRQRIDTLLAADHAQTENGALGIVDIRPASPRATTNYLPSFLARVKNFVMTPFKAVASLYPKAGYFLASREIRKNLAKEWPATYDLSQITRRISNLNRASIDCLVSDIALMERIDKAQYGFDDGTNRTAYFSELCEDINRRRGFWMEDTIQTVCHNDEPLLIGGLLSNAVSSIDCDIPTEAWISCVQKEFARRARESHSRDPEKLINEFHSIKEKISHSDTLRALEGGLFLFSMKS